MKQTSATANTYSTTESAQMLQVSVRTIQLWVEEGRLAAWKTPGGHRRIWAHSVDRMLAERGLKKPDFFDVLIVEDDELLAQFYQANLANLGSLVRVRIALDGYQGLIRIGELTPHLLLTDILMPGMDGYRMLASLRNAELSRPMQIVVNTSLSPEELRAGGELPNGCLVLHKPVATEQLLRFVGAHFNIWAMQNEVIPPV